ncbi:MAG: DEAD/DEAH box helicase [Egibacteraceae bacterium]
MSTTKGFEAFGVDERICRALSDAGITAPFPIQELTLPMGLAGADIIGQARTGTGKTLAFGVPLLQRLRPDSDATQALVIVPTRELCAQVHDDLVLAGANLGVRVVAVYGGKSMEDQIDALRQGGQAVVGTPGRLLDLMRRGHLDLSKVSSLVLDEADEMLDMGFLPDVEQLVEATATERQTLLFSATMPSEIVALARRYMDKPTFLRADVEEQGIAPATRQHFFACHRMDKPAVLARILQAPDRGSALVFTSTKRMADQLVEDLRNREIPAAAIHSNLRQDARERALNRFREGKVNVLCATEVAARGLDIDAVTHVVNYDCPDDERMYLHRIGRTGRAGAAGVAITLVTWNEQARLQMIKNSLDISEPTHEVFSTSPLLAELFELPELQKPVRIASPRRSDEDGGGSRRGSARRRASSNRRPKSSAGAPKAPSRPTTSGGAQTPGSTSGEATVRSRTRTRNRRRTSHEPATSPTSESSPPADAPQTDTPVSAEPAAAETPAPATPSQTSSAESERETPARASSPTRERGSRSRSRRGRQSRQNTSRRDERSREQRNGSSARGSDDAARSAQPTRAELSTRDARGEGKPALRRPLVIEHLP